MKRGRTYRITNSAGSASNSPYIIHKRLRMEFTIELETSHGKQSSKGIMCKKQKKKKSSAHHS